MRKRNEQTRLTEVSKFLSLILRHRPETIGLELEPEGWLDIDDLIAAANKNGKKLTAEVISNVVANDNKIRYAISQDGRKIRANQGHSVSTVELNFSPTTPPETLFHGTVDKFIKSIRQNGLQRKSRNHVHLSVDESTAQKVGMRRGKPVVLTIQSGAMNSAGYTFFVSENGVWLTTAVPSKFIEFPDEI